MELGLKKGDTIWKVTFPDGTRVSIFSDNAETRKGTIGELLGIVGNKMLIKMSKNELKKKKRQRKNGTRENCASGQEHETVHQELALRNALLIINRLH